MQIYQGSKHLCKHLSLQKFKDSLLIPFRLQLVKTVWKYYSTVWR